jgi:hypothetical protein
MDSIFETEIALLNRKLISMIRTRLILKTDIFRNKVEKLADVNILKIISQIPIIYSCKIYLL